MDIKSHFNLLLDKYNLNFLYKKFICLSILTTTVKEGFYWSLIYFSEIVKNKPELIKKFSIILIGMIGINIPLERYFNYTKAKFLKEIKMANTKYFNDRIIKMSKQELLGFDLIEYFNILDHFNDNLQEYIMNIKNKYDIPVRCMTLIVVAMNKKFNLLIGLFIVFYFIVKLLNEDKLKSEKELTKKFFYYENVIRNYIINGKNFLINDEFNKEYLTNNFNNFEKVNSDLESLFQHIKYYFPNTKTPKVITLISEMDYQNKAIYTDSLVLISLDLYLGKNHKFYEFPEYLKQNFEQNHGTC